MIFVVFVYFGFDGMDYLFYFEGFCFGYYCCFYGGVVDVVVFVLDGFFVFF